MFDYNETLMDEINNKYRAIDLSGAKRRADFFRRLVRHYNSVVNQLGESSDTAQILFRFMSGIATRTYGLDMSGIEFRINVMDNAGRIHPFWLARWMDDHDPIDSVCVCFAIGEATAYERATGEDPYIDLALWFTLYDPDSVIVRAIRAEIEDEIQGGAV